MAILEKGKHKFTFTDVGTGIKYTEPICQDYWDLQSSAEISNMGASKAIIITNILIRFFIIWIMGFIGAKT